ncbi:MAG: TetR family transcriptional regulator [Syntrophobacteraceae bacterium]
MDKKEFMRIGELEKKAGTPRSTIHFYLQCGLLHPPLKTGQTMAYYDQSHLKRLQKIKRIKVQGRVPLSFLLESIEKPEQRDAEATNEIESPARQIAVTTKAKDRRKKEIINAAIRIFSEKGYQRVTIRDITGSIGISTGTFYIYFKDKRELFVEVVDAVLRTIIGDAAEAIKHEEDIHKRLFNRGRVFYDNYLKFNEILHQLRAEMVGEDKWPHEKIKKVYHALTQPVIRDIQKGIDAGIYRKVNPDITAYAFTGVTEIMCLRTMIDDKYSFDEIHKIIDDLFVNGLKPEKSAC